jgi:hypothetical protein
MTSFTPLEIPLLAPCEASLLSGFAAGMEGSFLLGANTGFNALCEPSR